MEKTPEIESKKHHHPDPAGLLLIVGLIVGVLFCIFIPYGAGFDEEQHVVRVFDIAALNLLPNRSHIDGTPSFGDFIRLSYQRRFFQTPADDLLSKDIFLKPIDTSVTVAFPTRSIYPPIDFVPQSILARFFWRKLNAPVVPVAILIRLSGLLVYLLGAYLTIRLLPFGKWMFLFLALSPMALFGAATINADGFTNMVSFLFIGLTLNIYSQRDKFIPAWKIACLIGVILLLGLTKTGTILVLPLLFILPYKRMGNKVYPILILLAALLSAGLMLWWNIISIPGSHFSEGGGQSLTQQLQVILNNPLAFIQAYLAGNLMAAGRYFRDWVGVYGYWIGNVPEVIYWIYPIGLISALLLEKRVSWYQRNQRIIVAATFLFAAAGIAFIYSYLHYDPDESMIVGRQGRYFIFAAPLFFLSLAGLGLVPDKWENLLKKLTVTTLLVVIGFYSLGIYATYYTFCGSSIYTFQSCTQPVYKNLDVSETAPQEKLNKDTSITQEFVSVCGKVNRVDVNLKEIPENLTGTLRLSLVNDQKVIASKDFSISNLNQNGIVSLPVEPGSNQKNSKFMIKLESPDITREKSLGIAISTPKQYRDGVYTVAGEIRPSDLVFHFGCINPWTGQ